ncbi:SDR family NAD(P)-dependent oxidoreductase [Symbioplanes lichenis]|uniref:SDR family NAD(P)-dependent oxidoreductase n=1 Tax=Symbioplanes lichenis TaxID=1629072 RepID=UPI002739AB04|nr:SDR family NAD(P)-dependent oxidoreductase [Actinoplanes lichenis]
MTATTDGTAAPGIDPERLALCLAVIAEAEELDPEHPDALAVRRATAGLFKAVKMRRRKDRRDAILAHDRAVTAATATGAPSRIDDETAGLPLSTGTTGRSAGTLRQPRGCYICKQRYTEVDAFYHQLCPACAASNHAKREARTDLTGRRALLTGGRAKIGMYIALRLLRDGAHTTITTRFPNDAVRRFSAMPDSGDWLHRLRVVGLDLRDPAQVVALAESVAARGPLDILINNAAQTVRRPPGSYSAITAAESDHVDPGPVEVEYLGGPSAHTAALAAAATTESGDHSPAGSGIGLTGAGAELAATAQAAAFTPHALTALALTGGSASMERIADLTAIDAGGLVPDLAATNSWSDRVHEVLPLELLEVQLCNVTAPFILVSRLREAMLRSPFKRRYVVNVSAMEGIFHRGYKGAGHPHTNMAKAALNMLTRTSAEDMFADGILMTSVDTGWITDERPHPTKVRLADEGFHAPLDLVDGAARVYDPIVRGEAGEDVYGCFLKDYAPVPW